MFYLFLFYLFIFQIYLTRRLREGLVATRSAGQCDGSVTSKRACWGEVKVQQGCPGLGRDGQSKVMSKRSGLLAEFLVVFNYRK